MIQLLQDLHGKAWAGGKAARLSDLANAGFDVPPGFALSEDESTENLESWISTIGGFPVAVRSSANAEDLPQASFAGLYETVLDVGSLPDLRKAIAHARASKNSARVQKYFQEKKLDPSQLQVSILVQKMVPAVHAGVAFSIHPLHGDERWALIEWVDGLGEKLVSGQVTPQSAEVRLDSFAIRGPNAPFLETLARGLVKIQAQFGRPQDVEWAIDAQGKLWWLQSRPITRIQWRKMADEYTNADFRDGGVSARVCTPLMASLYRDVMQSSLPAYFEAIRLIKKGQGQRETWIDSFYGRPYWNASATKRILRKIPGFSESQFDRDLGIQKDYGGKPPEPTPTNLRTLLPILPTAIELYREFTRAEKAAQAFIEAFPALEGTWLAREDRLREVPDAELAVWVRELFEDLHFETEYRYFWTIYNNSNAQTELKTLLTQFEQKFGVKASLPTLLGGVGDVSHLRAQKELRELFLKRYSISGAVAEFCDRFYFHGDAELDLQVPRWKEDPTQIIRVLENWKRSGTPPPDPLVSEKSQREKMEVEKVRIIKALRAKGLSGTRAARKLDQILTLVRGFLHLREEMRECSSKAYYFVRITMLELARRWEFAEQTDVFFFDRTELLAWAKSGEFGVSRETLTLRKDFHRGYRDLVPPYELGGEIVQSESLTGATDQLQGVGCSAGVVEGIARVVHTIAQASELRAGEILVTAFTDPGWTPVFGMVAGVVTNVGGLLSHAAVISREYGIPAVLNTVRGTEVIKTGQRLRIDGDRGTVQVLSPP